MTTADEEFGTGLRKWNLQAWIDFFTMKLMISKVGDVVPKTYLPILRLVSGDAGKVDDAYAGVVALRGPIRVLDSPRDKWREMYGSYIRELNWVFGELQQHFSHAEYQELVVDIMARTIRDAMSAFLPQIEKMTRAEGGAAQPAEPVSRRSGRAGKLVGKVLGGPVGRWLLHNASPINAIVGPVELQLIPGGLEMFIPRCWMHTAPCDERTQDLACLEGCKGACEAIFSEGSPVAMHFEPHLPEYSCTLTVKLDRAAAISS